MAADDQSSSESGGRRRQTGGDDRVVIKKYANRRLYNTASSSYVTLEHLADMVREGVDFVVFDAKTNEDITRSVLTQIIFDEESRGQNLLPLQFLRQLIRFYGDSMQAFVPSFLEMSLDGFTRHQEGFRKDIGAGMGGAEALGVFQEQVRQNIAMFDRAMKMFSPFNYTQAHGGMAATAPAPEPEPPAPKAAAEEAGIAELRAQMELMQRQIEKLAAKK